MREEDESDSEYKWEKETKKGWRITGEKRGSEMGMEGDKAMVQGESRKGIRREKRMRGIPRETNRYRSMREIGF